MQRVVRTRHPGRFKPIDPRLLGETGGALPSFARPLGLDFIVTLQGDVVLIELQHGFGRRGLLELFPHAGIAYRKTFWRLRRQWGRNPRVGDGMREVCRDKIKTYRLFSRYQPSSHVFRKWNSSVERWLETLCSTYVLAKPPRGSCGEGILVLERQALLRGTDKPTIRGPMLLQEFVESRRLIDPEGKPRLGCIRHIVMLASDGARLSFVHLPSYWRVAPVALTPEPDREALTANISRGARPYPVEEPDERSVRATARRIATELVRHVLNLPELPFGETSFISLETE